MSPGITHLFSSHGEREGEAGVPALAGRAWLVEGATLPAGGQAPAPVTDCT
jgi:hypothetical protein